MHGRRHRIHHAQALSAALVAGIVLVAPAYAGSRQLGADGTLHTVDVQTTGGRNASVALRYTRQPAGGTPVITIVPGTEDAVTDREPAIEIDPVSGQLVLVWSRYDGNNYNVFLSRFNGTSWSAPSAVLKAAGDDVEPQIRISAHYVHVSWKQVLNSQNSFYRQSFLSTTLAPAYGPEQVRTSDLWPVPTEGSAASATAPDPSPSDEIFSAVDIPSGPDPGRCHIWGVRDEPVPIGYRECLYLPAYARAVSSLEAGWLGGRFTVSYVVGNRFHYATRANGAWSPTRFLELTAGLSVNDARWIVRELNARTGTD